jgi:hypothetical protein
MCERLLNDIYRNIKKSRDERLSRVLDLLRKKAANDPEIAEALRLLRPWAPGQGPENETAADDQ